MINIQRASPNASSCAFSAILTSSLLDRCLSDFSRVFLHFSSPQCSIIFGEVPSALRRRKVPHRLHFKYGLLDPWRVYASKLTTLDTLKIVTGIDLFEGVKESVIGKVEVTVLKRACPDKQDLMPPLQKG
jgi:hypothetical protein